MRIGIHAALEPGQSGGVEQYVIGLVHGLAGLDGDERFLISVLPRHQGWLDAFRGSNSELIVWQGEDTWRLARPDLVHFPFQYVVDPGCPYVFNPHDLQHLHLPEFFTAEQLAEREVWRSWCAGAATVVASSEWVRHDLVMRYQLEPAKVVTIVPGSPSEAYSEPDAGQLALVQERFGLDQPFVYYPAQTWPHKNHVSLLRALAALGERGLRVPLVCSGRESEHFPAIAAEVLRLNLDQQVMFVGFVDGDAVHALYRLARCVVLPTLFEAGSFPMFEAFAAGTPVACSRVTSLPEFAGDAALIFDPNDPAAIAAAIARLWSEPRLRAELSRAGARQIAQLSWHGAAHRLRDLYRALGGRPLLPAVPVGERPARAAPAEPRPPAPGEPAGSGEVFRAAARRSLSNAMGRCQAEVQRRLAVLEADRAARLAILKRNAAEAALWHTVARDREGTIAQQARDIHKLHAELKRLQEELAGQQRRLPRGPG